jgi:hypothetical protein
MMKPRSLIPAPAIGAFAAAVLMPLEMEAQTSPSASPDKQRDLARRILEDKRMDQVVQMGHELLKSGLSAGSSYTEVWIRDLNTFIVPLLDVTPHERVRDALLTFFHFQGEDGGIVDGYVPQSINNGGYKHRFSATKPDLKAHKNTVETDQESSLVQAVCRYITKTGDAGILDEVVAGAPVRQRLEMALHYPLAHRFSPEHGLIWGATTADWGDVQPEHPWGVEFDPSSHRAIDIYDNALLIASIGDYLDVIVGQDPAKVKTWSEKREQIREAVRRHLWDNVSGKFIPHLYLDGSPFPAEFDENRIFYHGGTTVAMEAGLLSKQEIADSLERMRKNVKLARAASIGLTLYPAYPEGFFQNKSMRPYSYQNGGDWDWFGARTIRQLAKSGLVEEAHAELGPMLDRVIQHGGFFEWWTPDNQPKGSGKFRGAAGVLIEAIRELRRWAEAHQ